MSKTKKTNAMRILDKHSINYKTYEYDGSNEKLDGITIAKMNHLNPNIVYKTLVTVGSSGSNYVYVIPVNKELNLKKAARVAKEKNVEMIPLKQLLPKTGYLHGGCSPIGMKKLFKTFVHDTKEENEIMVCSGGKRGVQIELTQLDLIQVTHAEIADVCL